MNRLSHKTNILNRSQAMRSHPSTFNGKEKDYESGFHYYGARYYWSEVLTGWLSVDPMADKYPSISPYAYCAWNPVKLVDPDGREVYINGEQADRAVERLQTKKLEITRDSKTGKISVSFREGYSCEDLSDDERMIYDAIDIDNISIQIRAEKSGTENGRHWYRSRNGNKYGTLGGAFDGSEFENDNGKKRAITYNFMDVDAMDEFGANQGVPHEVSEQFLLGQKTIELGRSIPLADLRNKNPEYDECHGKAIPQQSEGWFHWNSLGIHIPPSIFGKK